MISNIETNRLQKDYLDRIEMRMGLKRVQEIVDNYNNIYHAVYHQGYAAGKRAANEIVVSKSGQIVRN